MMVLRPEGFLPNRRRKIEPDEAEAEDADRGEGAVRTATTTGGNVLEAPA